MPRLVSCTPILHAVQQLGRNADAQVFFDTFMHTSHGYSLSRVFCVDHALCLCILPHPVVMHSSDPCSSMATVLIGVLLLLLCCKTSYVYAMFADRRAKLPT